MAAKKDDPTVTGEATGPVYPEGTHPARSPSEVTTSAENIKYSDNPAKPDSTSIAQLADVSALTGDPSDK
jgi:hypothetical protein